MTGPGRGREPGAAPGWDDVDEQEQIVLSDLVNRVLDKGVVIRSDITISVADIDLIQLDLRILISSVATLTERVDGAGLPVRSDSQP